MVRRIEDMFPQDLEKHIRSTPIVVLPLGTVEWHSDHLPLGLDGHVAAAVAEQIAERLDAVTVPTSYFAAGGVPYPFTLKFPVALIEPLFESAFEQLAPWGFGR
jgi:creatinine amidohydrolase